MFTKMIPFFLKKIHRKSQMNKNEIIFQNRYFQQGRYLNDANKNLVAITYSLRIKAKYIYMNICIGMTPSIVSMSSHFNGPSLNFCLTFESSTKKKIVNQVVINFEIDLSPSHSSTCPERLDKNLNILITKRAFNMNYKAFLRL